MPRAFADLTATELAMFRRRLDTPSKIRQFLDGITSTPGGGRRPRGPRRPGTRALLRGAPGGAGGHCLGPARGARGALPPPALSPARRGPPAAPPRWPAQSRRPAASPDGRARQGDADAATRPASWLTLSVPLVKVAKLSFN